MTQIMLTTEKLEKQLLAESHTLQMLKGHSRWVLLLSPSGQGLSHQDYNF